MFRKIAIYSAGLYAATMFAAFIRVFLRAIIAKYVGKEALGIFTFFTTAQLVTSSLMSFGLGQSLTKAVVAKAKAGQDYAQMVSAILALLVFISVLITIATFILRDYIDWVWVTILVSTGPITIFAIAQCTLRGQFERNQEVISEFFSNIMQGLGVTLLIVILGTPYSPIYGRILSDVIVLIVVIGYFIYQAPKAWSLTNMLRYYASPDFSQLMKLTAPLWLIDILGVIGYQADTFIVQNQLGYLPIAEYGVAFTFIGLLNKPLKVMSRMFLVTFSSGYYTDIKKYERASSDNLAFISTMGLTVTIISIPLIPIVFTTEYTIAPTLVLILSVAFIFKAVEVFNTSMTIAHDDTHSNLMAKIWTLSLYIPLSFVLIYYWGVIGAAWSNVFSESSYAIIHAIYMRRRFPDYAAHTFRQCFLGTGLYLGLTGGIWFLEGSWFILIAAIPLYLGLGHLFHLWDLRDIPDLARRLLPKRFLKPDENKN